MVVEDRIAFDCHEYRIEHLLRAGAVVEDVLTRDDSAVPLEVEPSEVCDDVRLTGGNHTPPPHHEGCRGVRDSTLAELDTELDERLRLLGREFKKR